MRMEVATKCRFELTHQNTLHNFIKLLTRLLL